jgi:hypothetical protein
VNLGMKLEVEVVKHCQLSVVSSQWSVVSGPHTITAGADHQVCVFVARCSQAASQTKVLRQPDHLQLVGNWHRTTDAGQGTLSA